MTVIVPELVDRRPGRVAPGLAHRLPMAGDGLLHPLALAALALLIVNDHLLKAMLPGPITGKLSDAAGLFLAPILVVAAIELCLAAAGRRRSPGRRGLVAICAGIVAVFTAVKTTAIGAVLLGAALGIGQWAGGVILTPLLGSPPPPAIAPVALDPTDLLALPAVAAALVLCLHRRAVTSRTAAP
jgi:hypothetical protein